MMKKLILPLLAAALALLLTACGNTDSQAGNSAPDPAEDPPSSSQDASAPEEGGEEPAAHEDEFAVEACQAEDTDRTDWFNLTLKVRNLTEGTVDRVSIQYQVLDANGDVLDDNQAGVNRLDAGQGVWTDTSTVQCAFSEMASVKLTGYSVAEQIEGKPDQYTALYGYDFSQPILIAKEDISLAG